MQQKCTPEFQSSMGNQAKANVQYLGARLIGRDTEVRLVLLSALARENSLLIGPPGTAKSLLATEICGLFQAAPDSSEHIRIFQTLMMRFTKPEEIFGPLDIPALLNSRHQRRTAGYLPEAHIAFLDEIFKANSAILNSLLTLTNERSFRNGDSVSKVPLISLIGASNELPRPAAADAASDALTALFDRFIMRLWFDNLPDDSAPSLFRAYLDKTFPPLPEPCSAQPFRISDLDLAWQSAATVLIPFPLLRLLLALRSRFHKESQTLAVTLAKSQNSRPPFYVSDRRWKLILRLMQIAAWYDGRSAIGVPEIALLPELTACHRDDLSMICRLTADISALGEQTDNPVTVVEWCVQQSQQTQKNVHATPVKQRTVQQKQQVQASIHALKCLQQLSDAQEHNFDDLESIWTLEPLLRRMFAEHSRSNSRNHQTVINHPSLQECLKKLESLQFPLKTATADIFVPRTDLTIPKTIDLDGLTFVHVATQQKHAAEWHITATPDPFLMSATMISERDWNRTLKDPTGSTKPKRGISEVELNAFFSKLKERLQPLLHQQGFNLRDCRLPTPDEWRAAVSSLDPTAKPKAALDAIPINCKSETGRTPDVTTVDDTRFRQGPHFHSLLGNCFQKCSSHNKSVLVGGSYLQSRSECFNTLETPLPDVHNQNQLTSFRIVLILQ
jgi:MoxR-like ATPase